MKKAWILILLTAFSAVYFSEQLIQSQVVSDKFKIAVLVDAGGKKTLNFAVASYFKRELRSLQDVEIVPAANMTWEHIVLIRIVEGLTESGEKNGYSCLSCSIYGKIPESHFTNHWQKFRKKNPAIDLLSGEGQIAIHPTHKLDEFAKEFIAIIDTKYLERLR